MAEIYNTTPNTLLSGTSSDDTIWNGDWWESGHYVYGGSNITINSGAGNDDISNSSESNNVVINAGSGSDSVDNFGSNVTINTGEDNDEIFNNCWRRSDGSIYYYGGYAGSNVVFKYNSGDGNDIIYGFRADSTLSIGDGSYSTTKSGDNVIVTVGTGKITLVSDENLSKINIKGTKTSQPSTEKNSWKLSGTTAKYGTSSKTLVTVSGVKSISGLSISGKVVTVAKSALNASKITISNGYTLALKDDVPKPSTKKAWSLSGTTATYKQTTSAGYKLASDKKSISYTKKATKTLATINGAKKSSGFTLSGNTIKLATASLSKRVSVNGSYAFEFASTYKNAKITGSASADTIKVAGANNTITGGKGNDSIKGGSGKDIFVYANGDGNDVITNYDENDIISIESGAAKISTSGNDVIFTVGTGKITVKNSKGKTITYSDASGTENIYPKIKPVSSDVTYNSAGTGATLKASYSKDTFTPSDYSTCKDILVTIDASAVEQPLKITGNKKKNIITGTGEDDSIYGGTGGDKIAGGAGNDKLFGNAGNDSLFGGAGEDSLWGGAGSDTLTGGDGSDIFYYDDGDGNDTITDYSPNIDTVIILSAVNVGNPVANSSGDVTFKIGAGQITFKDCANKYIELVDKGGNRLMKYDQN